MILTVPVTLFAEPLCSLCPLWQKPFATTAASRTRVDIARRSYLKTYAAPLSWALLSAPVPVVPVSLLPSL